MQENFTRTVERIAIEAYHIYNDQIVMKKINEINPSLLGITFLHIALNSILTDRLHRLIRVFEGNKDVKKRVFSFWYLYRTDIKSFNLALEQVGVNL